MSAAERNPPARGGRPALAAAPAVEALIAAADPADPDTVVPLARHIAAAVAEGMCGLCLGQLEPIAAGTGISGVAEAGCWSCRISWTAAQFTPADVLAAGYITRRGAVLTADQARTLTEAFEECPDQPGAGAALRVLASYYADQAMTVINARRADRTLPAGVLDWAAIGFGGSLDALIDAGVPAPDCAATEALLGEIQELIVRRLCAERAGLCAGGLNKILAALELAEGTDWDPTASEIEAVGRLADRVAGLLGASVAEPGGIGFTIE